MFIVAKANLQNVIMDKKRKKDYQELDSLIHSDSFFKTCRSLEH